MSWVVKICAFSDPLGYDWDAVLKYATAINTDVGTSITYKENVTTSAHIECFWEVENPLDCNAFGFCSLHTELTNMDLDFHPGLSLRK